MATTWVWLLPLAGLTVVIAYFSLLFSEFAAEALDGEVTARSYVISLGLPALLSVLTAAAGLGTAWLLARWTSRRAALARVYPFVLGASSAWLGAAVAALVFYAFMSGANWPAAQ